MKTVASIVTGVAVVLGAAAVGFIFWIASGSPDWTLVELIDAMAKVITSQANK